MSRFFPSTRLNEHREKVANLESMVSVHCTTLLEHVTIMSTSCFDTDFVSQIKLTKLPLIHCFVTLVIKAHTENNLPEGVGQIIVCECP